MIRIYPSVFSGKLNAPASKAHALRLLFMGSMPTAPTCIGNVPDCADVDTCISVLETLGCTIARSKTECVIHPFPKTSPMPSATLNFKESGTTARLATALCGALGINTESRANGTLSKRKLVQLTGRMAIRGITFSSFSLPFSQSGRLSGGEYVFEGDEGSQSISALMMFLPCLLNDSNITFSSPLIDRSFIDITKSSLDSFGIYLEETENGFFVPGRQYYQSPGNISVENDWGLASMWITAAAACGPKAPGLTVTNLPKNSHQMYRQLSPCIALLQQDFMDVNIDASTMPNLTTLFCALAIVKGATIRIIGVPQLKYKETDRLKTMAEIARDLGQDAVVTKDGITIIGSGSDNFMEDTPVNCKGDPWIFMSMALSAATLKKSIILDNEHGAEKEYRNFLTDFKKLGGKYDVI